MENITYKTYRSFNLNNYVLAKLNDIGYQKMLEINHRNHNCAPRIFDYKTIEDLKSEADSNGYTKFQMWELMYAFGMNMWNGSNVIPFVMDILIDESDLKDVE